MDEYERGYLALFPQLWSTRPRPTIVWDEEEGDEGVGPNGEYVSLWAPAPLDASEGWRVIIAVSEEAADRDEYLVERELPASMALEEVQRQAESLLT